MVSRRQVIFGAGAAGVALTGVGAYWRVTRAPVTAQAPWALGTKPVADVRLDAFRHAILAPNPHNRQPWLIKLEGDDAALLTCDLGKRLPQTDPFDRQITIGFGTFIELARIAAAERGFAVDVTPFPDGEPQPRLDARPVARLVFRRDPAIERDPLYPSIAARRTNREVYDRAPDAILLARVAHDDVRASADPALMAQVRALTVAAITTEVTTPRTWQESVDLLRIGHAEVDANPDGLALAGPMIEAGRALGLVDRTALADPASSAFRTGLDQVRTSCGSVPAIVWITTPGNGRAEQLDAGRRYVRANLRATAAGLGMHPLSQSLQEFPEMAAAFTRVHTLLGATPGERVQMLARIGHAAPVAPSARWPLEKLLIA